MPARDYGDLSRLALEAELDIGEFRERLQRMSDRQLLEFGHAASYMESVRKSGGQAAFRSGSGICGCSLNFGYHRRNTSSSSLLRTLGLGLSKRWAPRSVPCICCILTNRLLTTW